MKESCAARRRRRRSIAFIRELRSLIERHGKAATIMYSVIYADGLRVTIDRGGQKATRDPSVWLVLAVLLLMAWAWYGY